MPTMYLTFVIVVGVHGRQLGLHQEYYPIQSRSYSLAVYGDSNIAVTLALGSHRQQPPGRHGIVAVRLQRPVFTFAALQLLSNLLESGGAVLRKKLLETDCEGETALDWSTRLEHKECQDVLAATLHSLSRPEESISDLVGALL